MCQIAIKIVPHDDLKLELNFYITTYINIPDIYLITFHCKISDVTTDFFLLIRSSGALWFFVCLYAKQFIHSWNQFSELLTIYHFLRNSHRFHANNTRYIIDIAGIKTRLQFISLSVSCLQLYVICRYNRSFHLWFFTQPCA